MAEQNRTIEQRIRLVQAAVAVDKAKGDPLKLGEKVGKAAEAAMLGGINSEAWKKYMSLFANSSEQLQRLTTNTLDGQNDYLQSMRAYIVANGVCAPGTDAATMKGFERLGGLIDADKPDGTPLNTAPEQNVINLRPANVTEI